MVILNFIPNVPAKVFSGSAVVVGYLLIEDLSANEQNALGNWLMLAAQVLCTNAFYQQVQQERKDEKKAFSQEHNRESSLKEEIVLLKKMVSALNQEIQDLESNRMHK